MTENEIALNSEFARLDDVLRNFNVFEALAVQDRELKHSAFLGFLLDPNRAHGFGAKFLSEFLRLCSARMNIIIPLLDLHISLAVIKFEQRFTNNKSLDILVEIPYFIGGKLCVVAVEHKMGSTEREGQLKDYSEGLAVHYSGKDVDLHKIFLTARGDEPTDSSWTGVTHSEVVLPAVEAVLQNSEDMLSDYFIHVMNDYIETIKQESDTNSVADDLVASIGRGIVAAVRRDNGEMKRVSTLFPRAWKYLRDYVSDPRVSVLRWFEAGGLFSDQLQAESSNRTYLRISFLDESNKAALREVCSTSSRRWLASSIHLVLELEIRVLDKESELMDGRLNLVFGPTNPDFHQRQALYECLRGRASKEVSEHWARIKLIDIDESLKKVEFRALNSAQVQQWIATKVIETTNLIGPVINRRLATFFANKELSGVR